MQININKTEVMRVNNNRQEAIQLQGKEIKEADSFTYLGSVVSKDGGTDEDIRNRINKARHAFNTLRPIWRATSLSLQNKIRIFGTNVKSVLLYGSETWRVTKTNTNKLQTFINKCLRNVLQIRWPEMIPNEELWERTGQEQIITEIKRRKWGWIGHTLQKPATNTTRQALSWNPQGKRKVGRPRQTWRRSVEEELKAVGIRWSELGRTCQNRVRWRSIVTALCSLRNQEAFKSKSSFLTLVPNDLKLGSKYGAGGKLISFHPNYYSVLTIQSSISVQFQIIVEQTKFLPRVQSVFRTGLTSSNVDSFSLKTSTKKVKHSIHSI